MRKPSRAEKHEQVKRTAFMFARITRDADEIADTIEVTPRTVYRLLDRDDFHAELDALGYTGERNFRTKPARSRHPNHDRAKSLWDELNHLPRSKRGRAVAEQLNIPIEKVWNWMRNWREEEGRDD